MSSPIFSFKRRRHSLAAVFLATLTAVVSADTGLRDVVVTANRHETETDSLPATVTSLARDKLDRRLPMDDAALFVDEPDVAMPRDLRRHGATRINIRGIEDKRVVQLVDGVRLPDYYNGGGPTNFNLSSAPTTMPDFLKRVEIVRGAASSLYGSDAIGGVVGFVTLDPADLLGDGRMSAFRYRGTYAQANRGAVHTMLAAARGDRVEFMAGVSSGQAREYANQGSAGGVSPGREQPNPQSVDDDGVIVKLVAHPAAGHKITTTLEGRRQAATSDILRGATSLPRVSAMWGDDNNRRVRGSLEWEHKPVGGFYDRITARIYRQDAETKNYNNQRRTGTTTGCSAAAAGTNACLVEQDFTLDQETTGGGVQVEKQMVSGTVSHLLTLGADLARVRVEELRDGRIWSNASGFSKTLAGENYPLRDFANGDTDTVGLFVQDEIAGFVDPRLALTPGLRFDHTRLKPETDPLAQQVLSTLGRRAVEKSNGALSPKLGMAWKIDTAWSVHGQLARGFRAPSYNEVNGAFRNTAQLYAVVPNPDLRPETSVGGEFGLRYAGGALRAQIALFDNRYKDFIEQIQLTCPGDSGCYNPSGGYRTNIAVNLSRVRIHGAELRGSWDIAAGWRADGAFAHATGTNEGSGQPLNSVEPTRLSLAIAHEAGAWGAEARLRAAARKSRVDDTGGTWFRVPGYGTVDLAVWTRVGRGVRATVAFNNVFDRKYWLWSDIRQADARNPAGVDFYSQPGRHLGLALQADF